MHNIRLHTGTYEGYKGWMSVCMFRVHRTADWSICVQRTGVDSGLCCTTHPSEEVSLQRLIVLNCFMI